MNPNLSLDTAARTWGDSVIEVDNCPGRPIRIYDDSGRFSNFSTEDLVGERLNSFTGWLCGAGQRNLHINADGEVWAATCRLGGSLGNVFTSFKVPDQWIKCTKDLCTCGADLFIPKIKDETHRTQLRRTLDLTTIPENKAKGPLGTFAASERMHFAPYKQIHWEVGRRCNYDCSYCAPFIHNKTDPIRTFEDLMMATAHLQKTFIQGDKVNFIISGGEPTIIKGFLEWVQYLHSLGYHVSTHSNGSRQPEYYATLIHYSDLNLSYHFEFAVMNRFVEVVSGLVAEKAAAQNRGVGYSEVKIMMSPGRRQETLALVSRLYDIPDFKKYCAIGVVPIRDVRGSDEVVAGYDRDDQELFGLTT